MDERILNEISNCFIESVNKKGIFNISLEKAYNWLGLKLSGDEAQNILDGYITEYSHLIIKEDVWFSGYWFTVEGFKTFCSFVGSPRAWVILAHFNECSRKYRESIEEAKREIERLKEELKNAPNKLIKAAYGRDDARAFTK